jgi:flagellar motor switch protein FliN/FliY
MDTFADIDIQAIVSAAVIDTFSSMFALSLERIDPDAASHPDGKRYLSSVCFAGDAAGIVSLNVGEESARLMAANLTGVEPDKIGGTGGIDDMLAELGGILGGNLKSALTDAGLRCELSTPSFTTGSGSRIESLDLERSERLGFRCQGHVVWVEMGLKISEVVKATPPVGSEALPRAEEFVIAGDREEREPPAPAADAAAPPKAALLHVPAADGAAPFLPGPEPSAAKEARTASEDLGLDLLLDIPVELTVELGRTRMSIHELLKLRPGSAVKLARLEGEAVDILANDVLIARGEVVVRHEKYGIRITEITSRMERLRGLK